MKNIQFKLINPIEHQEKSISLLLQLNPSFEPHEIENLLLDMVKLSDYTCFGLFQNNELIGISSAWKTVRIYCGKQIELDNVIIDSRLQSQGYGQFFMDAISQWALQNNYKSIGLNTYVENSRSHKFYFNEGFKILGFHFEKRIS